MKLSAAARSQCACGLGAILPAVHVCPESQRVVHPGGSQRGSPKADLAVRFAAGDRPLQAGYILRRRLAPSRPAMVLARRPSPVGLTAADPFAGGKASWVASRVR